MRRGGSRAGTRGQRGDTSLRPCRGRLAGQLAHQQEAALSWSGGTPSPGGGREGRGVPGLQSRRLGAPSALAPAAPSSSSISVVKILRVLRVLRPLRAINRAKGLKVRGPGGQPVGKGGEGLHGPEPRTLSLAATGPRPTPFARRGQGQGQAAGPGSRAGSVPVAGGGGAGCADLSPSGPAPPARGAVRVRGHPHHREHRAGHHPPAVHVCLHRGPAVQGEPPGPALRPRRERAHSPWERRAVPGCRRPRGREATWLVCSCLPGDRGCSGPLREPARPGRPFHRACAGHTVTR